LGRLGEIMNLPTSINLGKVWSCIRRDSCNCTATLRAELTKDEKPRGYLEPGTYSGGFLKITEVTDRVPDNAIAIAIRQEVGHRPNDVLKALSPFEFRALYIIHRRYETTTG